MLVLRDLIRNRHGTTSVEFALIVTVLFLIIFGIIDMARLMWVVNSAAKATHWGARYAVVSDTVPSALADFDCLPATVGNGEPCPVSALSPNPVICTASGCNGYGPMDTAAFNAVVTRMQAIHSAIQASNVQVEYRHVGLGFSGNPYGPDIVPTVTVKLQGMVFNLVTPGLSALVSVPLPEFRTTLTGEDLSG